VPTVRRKKVKSYETLRAVALLIQEGYAGHTKPTPEQTKEFARGIVVLCDELESTRRLVADDSFAASFQTFGQYRTALLKMLPRGG
jgi:hypothetical protein